MCAAGNRRMTLPPQHWLCKRSLTALPRCPVVLRCPSPQCPHCHSPLKLSKYEDERFIPTPAGGFMKPPVFHIACETHNPRDPDSSPCPYRILVDTAMQCMVNMARNMLAGHMHKE